MMMEENKTLHDHFFKSDLMVKSLATGMVVSTAVQTGRGLFGRLVKSPVGMLTMGIVLGYLTHKYRKEIILTANQASGQSKDFLLRQKENLKEIFLDTEENTEELDTLK
jgi:hypothetical protein